MATSRDITLHEYMQFLGNAFIIRQDKIYPGLKYVRTNPMMMDDGLICKDGLLLSNTGYNSYAEPLIIFTQGVTVEQTNHAIIKLSSVIPQFITKNYPYKNVMMYSREMQCGNTTFEVLFMDLPFDDASYEDMLLAFETFRSMYRDVLKLTVQALFYSHVKTGLCVLNMANPVAQTNYMDQIMKEPV